MLEIFLKWFAVFAFGAAIIETGKPVDLTDPAAKFERAKIEQQATRELNEAMNGLPMSRRIAAACGPKATINADCMRKLNPGDPLWK